MPRFRIESDAHGDCKVPAEAYFGARTQRALASGPSCGQRMGGRFTWAMGLIKRSCCEANEVLGTLDVARAEWIATAAQEVMDGRLDDAFPLDLLQMGARDAAHANVDEVIANRAIELMGGEMGSRDPIDPDAHVRLDQDAAGVVRAAVHVSLAALLTEELLPAVRGLGEALESLEDDGLRRWVEPTQRALRAAEGARDALLVLSLGDSDSAMAPGAVERIADEAELPFRCAGEGEDEGEDEDEGDGSAVRRAGALLQQTADALQPLAVTLGAHNASDPTAARLAQLAAACDRVRGSGPAPGAPAAPGPEDTGALLLRADALQRALRLLALTTRAVTADDLTRLRALEASAHPG